MKFRLVLHLLLLVAVLNLQPKIVNAISPRATVHIKAALPQAGNSISSNEASMLFLLRYILSVEWTFHATTGNGRFGTLQELYRARLIDVKIRTGINDGYQFVLTVSNPTVTPPTFEVIARPAIYVETGVRTFTINNVGEIRVSYVQNPTQAQFHLLTDECESVFCTEAYARLTLRSIHSAEATFQATTGAGRFGTLEELIQQQLVSPSLATGILNGYSFRIRVHDGSKNALASFESTATPFKYYRTGIFSFFVDETGILRGGNKYGLEADANDDPICW